MHMAAVIANFWLFSIFGAKAVHSYLVIIGQPRETNPQGSALRPDLALAAGKCIVDFVLRNMTLYEKRMLFVFLETCHIEGSWLITFRRIKVMIKGV